MRIFISSQDATGTAKTTRLSVTNCPDTTQLVKLVCQQLNVNKNAFIFLVKNQIVNLRILDGWPLEVYNIKNGTWIMLRQNLMAGQKQWSSGSTASLQKIQQNSEDLSEELSSVSIQSPPKSSCFNPRQSQNHHAYFEQQLQRFLNAVRSNRLDLMASLLKQQPTIQDQEKREEVFNKKNQYVLNEIGQCGRNALHWAIHNQNIQIIAFLLMKSVDPTVLTIDQYTPLQLGVVHRNMELVKILNNQPKVDPNIVTSHGTALHLAVQHNCIPLIKYLIDNGANIDVLDREGKKPQQMNDCQEIKQIFQDHEKKLKLRFIKPNITKGNILKMSSLTWRGKQRTMMVNPFKGDMTLFKQNNIVDHKIKINTIKSVQKVTEKSWLIDNKLNYFKVIYLVQSSQEKLILAVKHAQILTRWIDSILLAKTYVNNEKYVTKIEAQMQLVEMLDDNKNEVKVHKRQVESKKMESPTRKKYSIMDMKVAEEKANNETKPEQKLKPKVTEYPQVHFEAEEQLQQSFNQSQVQGNEWRDSEILLGSILMEKNFQVTSSVYSTRNTVSASYFTKANTAFQSSSQILPQTEKSASFRKKSFDLVQISQFKPLQIQKVSFSDFDFVKMLGSGAFGQVYLTKHRKSQKVYAMKVLNKKRLMAKKHLKYAISQTNILKRMDHPFIVGLYYSFQTPSNLYLALDYCPHGDLSEVLCEKQRFTELTARFIIAQVILAIQYIHRERIIYRDLKPQNILLGKDGYIKLTDFGLSKENNIATSFCGSPAYLSPEMLQKKGHSYPTDIYGIGCILYEMVVGEPPYYDQMMQAMFQNIKSARLKFPGYLTKEIRSLISRMLQRDVSKRIGSNGMKQVKQHEFFSGFNWQKLAKKQLPVPQQIFPESIENQYFTLQSTRELLNYSDQDYTDNSMLNRIKGFSFVRTSKNSQQ